jgi:hypothetical protein
LLIQDQAENCCKSDNLNNLNDQKARLVEKLLNLKSFENLNKDDLVLTLNQIEQSVEIITKAHNIKTSNLPYFNPYRS